MCIYPYDNHQPTHGFETTFRHTILGTSSLGFRSYPSTTGLRNSWRLQFLPLRGIEGDALTAKTEVIPCLINHHRQRAGQSRQNNRLYHSQFSTKTHFRSWHKLLTCLFLKLNFHYGTTCNRKLKFSMTTTVCSIEGYHWNRSSLAAQACIASQ